jgi:hypothetical protein
VSDQSVAGDRALAKIRTALGDVRGNAVIERTLRAINLRALSTPDDCYTFGQALTNERGLLEAIGRAIMVQAILAGARAA